MASSSVLLLVQYRFCVVEGLNPNSNATQNGGPNARGFPPDTCGIH